MKDTNVTIEKKELFLADLTRTGHVSAAALAARISRMTIYRWRLTDLAFADAMDKARLPVPSHISQDKQTSDIVTSDSTPENDTGIEEIQVEHGGQREEKVPAPINPVYTQTGAWVSSPTKPNHAVPVKRRKPYNPRGARGGRRFAHLYQ